jgi:hypothetical protein
MKMALPAIGRSIGNPMSWFREPTIAEILSDSIVKAVMEADGVDPIELEAQLRSMAQNSTAGGLAGHPSPPSGRVAERSEVGWGLQTD